VGSPQILAWAAIAIGPQGPGLVEPFVDPGYGKVVWAQSPNFNQRPPGTVVDTVVLHHTAGPNLVGTVRWFANPESRVSSHFTVGKDGSIVQHVSTFARAWHAGESILLGRPNLNHYSIGIEMVNIGDGKDPWPKEQVEVVGFLIAHLRKRFPQLRYVTSHEFVAVPKGRKPDPKGFPWKSLEHLGLELIYDMSKRPEPLSEAILSAHRKRQGTSQSLEQQESNVGLGLAVPGLPAEGEAAESRFHREGSGKDTPTRSVDR